MMQIETRHVPSFGVARCLLTGGEQLKVEAGAMMMASANIHLEAKMEGGLKKSLKRSMLGGESFYVSTFTAPAEGGFVDVAAKLPGDMKVIQMDGLINWIVEGGNWIASEQSVTVDSKWKGMKSMAGGEGGFMLQCTGHGQMIIASYGAIEEVTLQPGQDIIIDSGHVLAFQESVQWELTRAVAGKSMQSAKSGEGLVYRFSGPGTIMTQTRNQSQLLGWIRAAVGRSGSGGLSFGLGSRE
jgi:uncharacterized protein (TIGR00266 family)